VRLRLPAFLIVASLPALALGTWIAVASGQPVSPGLGIAVYLLANLVVFTDALDLIVRAFFRRWHTRTVPRGGPISVPLDVGTFTPYQMSLHLRPFALVVSVHNAADELDDFLEAMERYHDRLWVIDDASTDDTWFRLQQSPVRCLRASTNRRKPGAIKELLPHLPPEVATVVVLDPDVRFPDNRKPSFSDLEEVIFDFQLSRMAAVTPRVAVSPGGWLARLQAFEYAMTCSLGRRSLADRSITSGVAIYRRDALATALDRHSLSVYAEDLRNALILLGQGEAIYYDGRLVVQTGGKRSWRAWFSQRVGWFYGLLRVYAEHLGDVRRSAHGGFFFYQFVVYMGLFTVLLHPFRLLGLGLLALSTINGIDFLLGLDWVPDTAASMPTLFLFAYLKYTAVALVAWALVPAGPREWLRLLPAVPVYFFYALLLILPATTGYLNWLCLSLGGGRIYRDHYESEESLREQQGSRRG
jgi:cellulose synthase/poly-beta-1,6-N-acetylglucosamine synthase-like glycosyltransferase